MPCYLKLLTGLYILLGLVSSEVVIHLSVDDYRDDLHFDYNVFKSFQECLCHNSASSCSAQLTSYYSPGYGYYYKASNILWRSTFNPEKYSKNYECVFSYPDRIYCERLSVEAKISQPPSNGYTSCQVLSTSCDKDCFNIVWDLDQYVLNISVDSEHLRCGLCGSTSTTPSTTTIASTDLSTGTTVTVSPTYDNKKGDDSSKDTLPLTVGVVVAVIVIVFIAGIIFIIWWRRKRNSEPPSTSHHYTTSTEAISHNYENTDEIHGHVNRHVASVPNTYITADNESLKSQTAQRPGLRNSQAVVPNNTGNHGTVYSSIDDDVTYTVTSPVNGPHNNDNTSTPSYSSTTPASNTYSRLGQPVRNIQNPYNTLSNPDEYSLAQSTPTNSNTSVQYSFAGPAGSLPYTQDSETVHNATPSSQPTNRNAYGYEEMTAPVASNDYEESPTHASGDNKYGDKAPKEPDYTNFPVKEFAPAKNEYAKLGQPVRNIQNPYDVMVNQEENGLEESTS